MAATELASPPLALMLCAIGQTHDPTSSITITWGEVLLKQIGIFSSLEVHSHLELTMAATATVATDAASARGLPHCHRFHGKPQKRSPGAQERAPGLRRMKSRVPEIRRRWVRGAGTGRNRAFVANISHVTCIYGTVRGERQGTFSMVYDLGRNCARPRVLLDSRLFGPSRTDI
jgi:hypothetical protein